MRDPRNASAPHPDFAARSISSCRASLQRAPCRDQRLAKQRPQIAYAARFHFTLHRGCKSREHCQDRSFLGLGQRFAGVSRSAADGIGETFRVEFFELARAVPDAQQELREDRAGVAASAVRAASATRVSVWPACWSGSFLSATSTACSVSARFVPVRRPAPGNIDLVDQLLTRDQAVMRCEARRQAPCRQHEAGRAGSDMSG